MDGTKVHTPQRGSSSKSVGELFRSLNALVEKVSSVMHQSLQDRNAAAKTILKLKENVLFMESENGVLREQAASAPGKNITAPPQIFCESPDPRFPKREDPMACPPSSASQQALSASRVSRSLNTQSSSMPQSQRTSLMLQGGATQAARRKELARPHTCFE